MLMICVNIHTDFILIRILMLSMAQRKFDTVENCRVLKKIVNSLLFRSDEIILLFECEKAIPCIKSYRDC